MTNKTLAFPNPSRSFDETHKAIHFIGYDGMIEVRFSLEAQVLSMSGSNPSSEAEYLKAFDTALSSIHDVARKTYSRGNSKSFTLTPTDF